jgi:hypothetical protein
MVARLARDTPSNFAWLTEKLWEDITTRQEGVRSEVSAPAKSRGVTCIHRDTRSVSLTRHAMFPGLVRLHRGSRIEPAGIGVGPRARRSADGPDGD